jgi:hypothetical protein
MAETLISPNPEGGRRGGGGPAGRGGGGGGRDSGGGGGGGLLIGALLSIRGIAALPAKPHHEVTSCAVLIYRIHSHSIKSHAMFQLPSRLSVNRLVCSLSDSSISVCHRFMLSCWVIRLYVYMSEILQNFSAMANSCL